VSALKAVRVLSTRSVVRLVALLCAATAGGRDLAVAHLELWGVFRGQNMYKVFFGNIQLTRWALICKIRGIGWRLIQSTRSQSNGPCLSFQVSIVSWFSLDIFSFCCMLGDGVPNFVYPTAASSLVSRVDLVVRVLYWYGAKGIFSGPTQTTTSTYPRGQENREMATQRADPNRQRGPIVSVRTHFGLRFGPVVRRPGQRTRPPPASLLSAPSPADRGRSPHFPPPAR
jgi:hypothetical protein